mgnify:CR=1 FL=1
MELLTLRQARKAREKTQKEVADYIGVDRTTYIKLEENPEKMTIAQAKKVSEFLDINYDMIFFAH